jgi:hypothetical protein
MAVALCREYDEIGTHEYHNHIRLEKHNSVTVYRKVKLFLK